MPMAAHPSGPDDRLGNDVPGGAGDGLRQHPALAIEHAGREVAGLAHDRREGGAQEDLRLLLDDRDEAAPHHLEIDFGQRVCGQVPAPARQVQPSSRARPPCLPATPPIAPVQSLADILTTVDWSDARLYAVAAVAILAGF